MSRWSIVVAFLLGLLIGTVGLYVYAERKTATVLAEAKTARDLSEAKLKQDLQTIDTARREAVDREQAAIRDSQTANAQRQAVVDARAAEAVEVTKPVAPAVRARRVEARIQAPAGDVVPLALDGNEGYWIAAARMVDFELALAEKASHADEIAALMTQVDAVERRAAAVATQLKLADETIVRVKRQRQEDAARCQLVIEKIAPAGGMNFGEKVLWSGIGAGAALAIVGTILIVNELQPGVQ